jgi:hypothetical protein
MQSSRNGLARLSRWVGLVGAALMLSFPLGFLRSERTIVGKEAETANKPTPFAPKLVAAKNPVQLTVLVEPGALLGWISGTADRVDASVTIRRSGLKAEQIKVEPGNTFTWTYNVAKEQPADIVVGDLRQTVTLLPKSKSEPTAFFILDRQVFRPGQALHFVAFLRVPDAKGEFVPIADKPVEVQLVSEKKKTTVKKWNLTADAFGKIASEYTFAETDPLEAYTLTIDGHRGAARLALAEYRKLTNQLILGGEFAGGKLNLHYKAVDFQGQPIPAEKINLTTQIVVQPHSLESGELSPSEFVYAAGRSPHQPSPENLSDNEQLLARFHSGPLSISTAPEGIVWESKNQMNLDASGKGDLALEIPQNWRNGRYAAIVHAVLVDSAGREMKAQRAIPLDGSDSALHLEISKSTVVVNEPIRVKASTTDAAGLKGAGSLVVLRLTAVPQPVVQPFGFGSYPSTFMGFGSSPAPGFSGFGIGSGPMPGFSGISGMGFSFGSGPGFGFNPPGGFGFGPPCLSLGGGFCSGTFPPPPYPPSYPFPPAWNKPFVVPTGYPFGAAPKFERQFVTAVVFQGDTATLKLSEPGAYKLVAVWNHADGRKWQQEIGCVVRPRDTLSGFTLQLEKDSLDSGDRLAGTILSRFSDARVLLVLRDSAGFRWAKSIRLKDGRGEFNEDLPKDLKYGACVEALYADRPSAEEPPHHASQFLHVVPRDRIIKITAKHKEKYEPGEKVTLDLEVDRQEPVDLIVSVFDRALLDVTQSRPADIRNFYLADDRVRDAQARDLLRRALGNVPLLQLVRRAGAVKGLLAKDSPDAVGIEALIKDYNSSRLTLDDLAVLLRLAGLHARHVVIAGAKTMPAIPLRKSNATLLEILEGNYGGWSIHLSTFYDTVLLAETHPTERPIPYPPSTVPAAQFGNPMYPNYPSPFTGGFGGGMGMGSGMKGMGGYGGLGMAGFGGGFNSSISGGTTGFGGGVMGMVGIVPGFFPQGPPLVQPIAAPEINKIPGGLDTGEVWIRRDFADLAYWNANVRTDANGKARVEFKLPDSLTVWEVHITAIAKQMHVGSAVTSLQSSRPIMVSPVLPRLFAEGDEVQVSAIVANRSGKKQTLDVKLEAKNGDVMTPAKQELEVADNSQVLVSWKFKAGSAGQAQLMMTASCAAGKDASLKRLPIVRAGADQVVTWSGYAKGQTTLTLPEGVKPEEAKLELTFAPSLAADLVDTLDYLVEYPYGCVEQTMSRFLPAVKVAQVLKRKKIDNPELIKKLPSCVEAGIKRLMELQQRDGGWAWQGSGQTHEMMTPYALYGLIEAERAGYAIPSERVIPMGLARLRKYIETLGEAQTADRVYCMSVYSLKHDLDDEWWKFVERQAENKQFSDYALALSLEMSVRLVRTKLADKLAAQLRERAVDEEGQVSWRTAGFSRWGDDRFEITAAALRALVTYDKDDPLIPKVIAFFTATKRGNRWNSTKDTAMIVFALSDYLERQREDTPDSAKLLVRVNDGEPVEVAIEAKNESRKLTIPAKLLKAGKNIIRFEKAPAGIMVRANLRFARSGKDVAPLEHGLRVSRQFFLMDANGQPGREVKSGDTIPKGSYLLSTVEVVKPGKDNMSFLLVECATVCGSESIPADDKRFKVDSTAYVLREDREGKVVFHHEQAPQVATDRCVLHVEMAGEFVIPPARAELMYQTDKFGHSGTFALKVE